MKIVKARSRLYVAAALVLIFGLGFAVLIYLDADNEPADAFGYDSGGSYVYHVMPEDSKMHRHDLELYGGKANVLADDLRRWVAGLWHGKSLAFTVACCSVFISLGLFVAAGRLPADLKSDASRSGSNQSEKI